MTVRGGDGDHSVRGCGARPLGVDVRRASGRAQTHRKSRALMPSSNVNEH